MSAFFSIIIPIYNVDQHLGRCFDSILNQTYADLEIIAINDGSTDSSGAVCDSYAEKDKRIKVIHQQNRGVSEARNAGLNNATGKYISFIDPDDWIEPDMYQVLYDHVKVEEIDILRFNAYRKGEILNELPFEGYYSGNQFEDEIMLPLIGSEKFGGMFILGVLWLHIYKRDIIEKYKIRFNRELRRCEDRLFTLTVALHADNMLFVKNILYHYEVYQNSLSNKYDSARWHQELTYLDQLKKEYSNCKSDDFIKKANARLNSEYLLRSITSINNEFFSVNKNSFSVKRQNSREIINNLNVKQAIKQVDKESADLKGKLILNMIKYRSSFLLSLFNTLIVLKNRI